MNDDFETESERRKAFIAQWRADNERLMAGVSDERNAHVLDARKCTGAVKEAVEAALEAKLARLAERNRTTPVAPLGAWRGAVAKPGDAA
jgi:hypothetical protein